jgi:hypothetical protein
MPHKWAQLYLGSEVKGKMEREKGRKKTMKHNRIKETGKIRRKQKKC